MVPSPFAPMELQRSKRRRVYSFEPSKKAALSNFSYKYLAYLLPALVKIWKVRPCYGSKDKEMEKIVSFEVNMALVASAGGFAWTQALRRKLERGLKVIKKSPNVRARQLVTSNLSFACKQKNTSNMVCVLDKLWALPPIPRALATTSPQMHAKPRLSIHKAVKPKRIRGTSSPRRKLLAEDDQELHERVRTLRKVLPGGNDMGVVELLSEVGSYVVCLKLQVNILQSLLQVQ